jgi:hypothetical protein
MNDPYSSLNALGQRSQDLVGVSLCQQAGYWSLVVG